MKPMSHRGYVARIEYSDEDQCFVGRVAGIQDIITFHGESVDELLAAFKEAVDFYIDTPVKSGRKPQKPFSGRLTLRLPPELHAQLALDAEVRGKSLNSLVIDTLAESTARQGI